MNPYYVNEYTTNGGEVKYEIICDVPEQVGGEYVVDLTNKDTLEYIADALNDCWERYSR